MTGELEQSWLAADQTQAEPGRSTEFFTELWCLQQEKSIIEIKNPQWCRFRRTLELSKSSRGSQRISEGSMMAVVDIVDTVDTQARASVTNRNQDMVSWLHDMGSHVYKCHRM
jgi:hypothetical protein